MAPSFLSSRPSARVPDYLDTAMFASGSVTVEWMNYDGYPEHPQLFPAFEHGLAAQSAT